LSNLKKFGVPENFLYKPSKANSVLESIIQELISVLQAAYFAKFQELLLSH
jgi:hypothetical protein